MRFSQFALSAMIALTGCRAPDYTPVRDWAATASVAADYPAVAAVPAQPPIVDPVRGVTNPPDAQPTRMASGIWAMQYALSVYLAALGRLASDGVLPYRDDPFLKLVGPAGQADETGGRAVAALGIFLRKASRDNLQAPDTGTVIDAADDAVQALIGGLADAVARQPSASVAAGNDIAPTATPRRMARGPATPTALAGPAAGLDPTAAVQAAGRAQYIALLRQIADGHTMLRGRVDKLTSVETAYYAHAAEDQLRRATAALPRPALVPTAPLNGGAATSPAG